MLGNRYFRQLFPPLLRIMGEMATLAEKSPQQYNQKGNKTFPSNPSTDWMCEYTPVLCWG